MEKPSFGAFSWLWEGFGVSALCLPRGWDISVTSQKAAMARSCLNCSKKPCYFNIEDPFSFDFFFFLDLKQNSSELICTELLIMLVKVLSQMAKTGESVEPSFTPASR